MSYDICQKRRRPKSGFTLGEVLVAMFVIIVGIAGVTSSIYWATKKQDSGKLMTEATNHARVLFETIVEEGIIGSAKTASAGGWPDGTLGLVDPNAADRTPLADAPFDAVGFNFQAQVTGQSGVSGSQETSSNTGRFTRNITVTQQTPAVAGVDDYLDDLALLSVTVFWNEGGHEREVTLEGLVNH